jgi:alpha-glucosidase
VHFFPNIAFILNKYWLTVSFMTACFLANAQRPVLLQSPSSRVRINIEVKDSIYYSVNFNNIDILSRATAAMITSGGSVGINGRVQHVKRREVRSTIINPVPFKRRVVPDRYNEVTIRLKGQSAITFRAYDDGIAYRFETAFPDSITIEREIAHFAFQNPDTVYFAQIQKRDQADIFHTSFEEPYRKVPLQSIGTNEFCFTPILASVGASKVFITESDLIGYPGMFLRGSAGHGLHGIMARYPSREEVQGSEYKQWVVTERSNYIARTLGTRTYPWRVVGIAAEDKDLLLNDLVYRLATPAAPADWSWIKTGICTDEWIISSNLYNVDFRSGVNTATYKYYVDFAKHFGIPMVMLDAGWSSNDDLLKITDGLDLAEVVRYARQNNIDIMLWTLAMTLDRQLDQAMRMFTTLGIAGINVDFMDRDDQKTVAFYQRIASAAAKNKLTVMFHGAFKNAGFERTHPNAVTREAILGSEYNMWSDKATPDHDVTIPFVRMMSGPLDYEPGFLINAGRKTFRPLPEMVMSQGTRTHQLAMFVVYESPVQVFAGNPSQAALEPAYTRFMTSLPTTWDEILPLAGKVGDFVAVARRKGDAWYIGALNDWSPRDVEIDLNFLGDKPYRAQICSDGINADKAPVDYSLSSKTVKGGEKLLIHLAAGGGYVAKIIPLDR